MSTAEAPPPSRATAAAARQRRRSPLDFDARYRAEALDAVERELFARDELAPLHLGGADERAWIDCDLASLAENRIGDITSPDALTDDHRAHWLARATTEPPWAPSDRLGFQRTYWLRSRGHRVGTLALATGAAHGQWIRASSLYVLPRHRRQGTASTMLRQLRDRLGHYGLVLGLDTSWTWQPVVRMYLRMGAWVHVWKRELTLFFDASLPTPIVELQGDRATLHVELDGMRLQLHQARRQGDRLLWEPSPSEHPEAEDLRWRSSSTFALALALHGWPLVRSQADWDRNHFADAGPPEALASRIMQWEARAHHHGWRVPTPRIPGLRYPSWEELEARWALETLGLISARSPAATPDDR